MKNFYNFPKVNVYQIILVFLIFGFLRVEKVKLLGLVNIGSVLRINEAHFQQSNWEKFYYQAFSLAPSNQRLRWHWGEVLLNQDRYIEASEVLSPLKETSSQNPLFFTTILRAFSFAEKTNSVIALAEEVHPTQDIGEKYNDLIALAYMNRAEVFLLDGNRNRAYQDINNAAYYRPEDLWVNYHLWNYEKLTGNVEKEEQLKFLLNHFPLQSIEPTDERLFYFLAEAIFDLHDDALWDKVFLERVIAFLVWQHYKLDATESMLNRIAGLNDNEPIWMYYLGELYSRRGDYDQAIVAYRQSLQIDSDFLQSYQRLGFVGEKACELHSSSCFNYGRIVNYYSRHQQAYPRDLLTAKYLSNLSHHPDHGDNSLDSVVGQLLNVPSKTIILGNNLLQNGDFESWYSGEAVNWLRSYQPREFQQAGLFVTDNDPLFTVEGNNSARVLGVWLNDEHLGGTVRVGYWYGKGPIGTNKGISLSADTYYVLSFLYFSDSAAKIWTRHIPLIEVDDYSLPNTNGQFWKVVIVFKSMTEMEITPLFRLYGLGNMILDDVQVRRLKIEQEIPTSSPTHIWVSGTTNYDQ